MATTPPAPATIDLNAADDDNDDDRRTDGLADRGDHAGHDDCNHHRCNKQCL